MFDEQEHYHMQIFCNEPLEERLHKVVWGVDQDHPSLMARCAPTPAPAPVAPTIPIDPDIREEAEAHFLWGG